MRSTTDGNAGSDYAVEYPWSMLTTEATHMVGKVTEITSTSKKGFEDAIAQGLARANKTIRNVKSAWVKEQTVRVTNGKVTEYQVNMLVTFVLDE
jgi:flavin-binding protein dodecin